LVFVTALAGGSAFAQRSQQAQRGRQRQNQGQSPRQARVNGNFAFQARAFPAEYSLLLTRTLFAKTHRSADVPVPNVSNNSPPRRSPENVFRGAMCEGTHYLASIENTSSGRAGRTAWLSEGGIVGPQGIEITQIALDHLIVRQRGSRRLVQIGQSIEAGQLIANPSTLPAIANAPRPSAD
jgi:hypothetical protein